MELPARARALVVGTVALGIGVLAVAVFGGSLAPLQTLALLGGAVVLTELVQVSRDERSFDPADTFAFSFSSGVHLAAVVIAGPWSAALVAAFGVLAVDRMRGDPWRKVAYNASVFALAAAAGGHVFSLLGGETGRIDLPADLPAFAGLAGTYAALNIVLVNAVVALAWASSLRQLVRDSVRAELSASAGEAGLGLTLSFFALSNPWKIVALLPLGFAVYQAHARLALLRRETARALEAFANVVDERDPYTYRHSARVADYVEELGRALRLPPRDVARLRWAGRLHDLGKVAVDASVLRKPTRLDPDEWTALRRHPRLSARLLRPFRFAAGEARAVEYHHERFDGYGYYGIERGSIPLAAHFLAVADSYDAMTSDRPYRSGLPVEEALGEIEANAGLQFHPAVARAFVALRRGLDPVEAVTPADLDDLRSLSFSSGEPRLPLRGLTHRAGLAAAVATAGGLGLVGFGHWWLAGIVFTLAAGATAWRSVERRRAGQLAASLAAASSRPGGRDEHFAEIVATLAKTSHLRWAGLVAWTESELSGAVELTWTGSHAGPAADALTSWLVREGETEEGLLVTRGIELGGDGVHVAVPLRGDDASGYLVLWFAGGLPARVEIALEASAAEIAGLALPSAEPAPRLVVAAAS